MIDISTLTATDYSGGGLHAQVKLPGLNSTCAPGLAYHAFGFMGRPKDPTTDANGNATKGARVLHWYEGSTLHTLPLDDPRRSNKLPTLDKGGSIQYADVDGAYGLFGSNGAYQLRVPAGTTVTVQVGSGASIVVGDSTVKIGDSSAQAIGLGAAVGAILAAIVGCTPAGPETGLTALKLAITTAGYTGTPLGTPFQTTKAMGT